VSVDEWRYVEISWSLDTGLEIYADLTRVANDSRPTKTPADHAPTDSRLCVACFNAQKNDTGRPETVAPTVAATVAATVAVDQLSICYGSLSKLTEFEFLQRGISSPCSCIGWSIFDCWFV